MLNIQIKSIQNDRVIFTTEKSEDAYSFAGKLLSYKSFKYDSETHTLSISITEWARFYRELLEKTNEYNVRFSSPKLFKTLSEIEEVPLYSISKQERFILIRCEKGSNPSLWMYDSVSKYDLISGVIKRDFQTHSNVEFPLSEAYRLLPLIANVKELGVPYKIDDETLAFASKQHTERESLDKLALAQDTEYPDVLDTIKLRPFQKVGAKFVEATQGRAIICDEM